MNTSIRSSLAVAGCLSVLLVQTSNCYASSNITLRDNVFSNLINKGAMTGAAATIGAGVSATVEENIDAFPNNPLRIVDQNDQDLGAAEGDVTNLGTLSNDEEITIKLTNDSVVDGGGTLTLTNNSSNSGTIEQTDITVNKGFNNDGTITVEVFKNNETGDITGSGTINITSTGANNGKFSGQNIIVGDSATFENEGSISGGSITVNGGEYAQNGTMDGNLNLIINEGTVKVSKDKGIDVNGQIKIETDGTVELGNKSTITMHNSDTWDGTIENSNNGTVTLIGATIKNETAIYTQEDNQGSLVLDNGSTFQWNSYSSMDENGSILVNGGSNLIIAAELNTGTISTNGTGNNSVDVWDTVGEDVNLNITDGITYNVLGDEDEGLEGILNINAGDKWSGNGTVAIKGGSVIYEGNSNGKLQADYGKLELNPDTDTDISNLTIGNDSYIKEAVELTINEDVTVNILGGSVALGTAGDENADTWAGAIVLGNDSTGGSLTINGIEENGVLVAKNGELTIKGDSKITIGEGSSIAASVNTVIDNSEITINDGGSVALNSGDTWKEDSIINLGTNGTLDYDNLEANGTLVATGGNLNVSGGKLTLATNSSVAEAVATTVNGDVDITGGSLALNGSDTWASDKTVKMTDGTFDYSLTQNGKVDITGGEFNIKDGAVFTMNDSNDKLGQGEDDVAINLAGTLNVKEGNATINANDTWTGKVTVTDNGNLNIDSVTSHGILQATGGTMNVNKSTLDISGNNVIAGANKTTLTESIVNISNSGSVTLDDNATDSWVDSTQINLNEGGKLDYNLNANGDLAASAGELTTHKGSKLEITSENSYIQSAVAAKLEGDLLIGEKGVVTVGDDRSSSSYIQDVMTGNVTIEDKGILNIYNSVKLATGEEAKNQYITINGTGLMNLEISTGEALHFETGLKGDGDIHKNGDGDVWFHGDYENYTGTILINNSGDLYFEHDLMGGLELGDIDGETIGINADKITGDLVQEREATIKYSTYHDDVDLNLNGDIKVTKGTIIAESKGDTNINFGGEINVIPAEDAQNPVEMNVTSKGNVTFDKNVSISDSTLNLTAGKGASFNQNTVLNDSIMNVAVGDLAFNNLVFEGTNSTLNDMNGAINNNAIKNLDITKNGLADFKIDVNGRKWQSDKFIISDITEIDGGQINVSDWQLLGKAPIDRHIKLNVFDVSQVDPAIAANINYTQTDKEIFTPIGWYKLENATQRNALTGMREPIPGTLNASLARYNPQVFRGQVATMAMYNNQLVIDDMLTNHVPLQSERYLAQGTNANKYASVNPLFAPYQYRKEDGGIWVKNYVTFEHLSMTHNLKVGNNAYGTLIGADFPVVNMKNGWKFLPTAYIGYNGGHQHFDGVSMYQNGGQGGFMGTFMKKDFIGSVVAYAGGYFNEMKVAGYSDETGNWFAGTAAKASYNLHATKHFSVQPNLFVSYNAFGKQNWSTDFGDMSMASGMINGVNVAPGLNLIYARETWSLYGTFQYMYNINEGVSGNAGHVDLPDVKMKHGYIQYGLGVTKTWKDRLNSFFQLTFRNGGRTGIGFQLGFQYLFDWFKGGHKKTSSTAPKNKTLIKKL